MYKISNSFVSNINYISGSIILIYASKMLLTTSGYLVLQYLQLARQTSRLALSMK